MAAKHPTETDLQRFVQLALPVREANSVYYHLRACATCKEKYHALTTGNRLTREEPPDTQAASG